MRLPCIGMCLVALTTSPCTAQPKNIQITAPSYTIIDRVAGPGTDWDYLFVDSLARRLYIAHSGVTVLDLDTNKLTTGLVAGTMTHSVLPLGNGVVAVDDSGTHTVTLFDGATGKVRATLSIPKRSAEQGFKDPDAMAFDRKTGFLVAVNGDSGELVLIDPKKPSVVDRIAVGGQLEFAVTDGAGTLFVNIESANEIAAVNVIDRRVVRRFPLKECEEPTGLSFDEPDDLLISVCANGAVEFVDPKSGHVVKTLMVGKGPDAVVFDASRHLAFVPSGDAGTLSVIAVRSSTDIALVDTVQTQIGARTAGLDPSTGRLFVPVAKFGPPTPPFPFPSAIEGTFAILVVAPK